MSIKHRELCSKNCEKLSSEIKQIKMEFADAQNRAQNVCYELSAKVVHTY